MSENQNVKANVDKDQMKKLDLSFVGNTIEALQLQVNGMTEMYNEIVDIKSDMSKLKDGFKGEIAEARKYFDDNTHLRPAELSEIEELVRLKSIGIVKMLGIHDPEKFKKEVGKTRSRIWRKHNKTFRISSYKWLPRKSFKDAKRFIQGLTARDFFDIEISNGQARFDIGMTPLAMSSRRFGV